MEAPFELAAVGILLIALLFAGVGEPEPYWRRHGRARQHRNRR